MRKLWISLGVASLGLAGPSTLAQAGLFSATGPVIAILANDLFIGEAEGRIGGAGTLAIHAQKEPALTCAGEFTSNDAKGGEGRLRCSDGTMATFQFKRLSMLRGHGTGDTSRGPLSFAYGLSYQEAVPYLKLPGGKKLWHNGTELALADL
jgi:hypothetical protein